MKRQLFICFIIIFAFTFLPYLGLVIGSPMIDRYDINGLATANLIHILIIYLGVILAFNKIKKNKYEWKISNINYGYKLKLMLRIAIILALLQFFIRGNAIFHGAHRGDVRMSLGIFGPLSTFIGQFGIPCLLSLSTVFFFFYSSQSKKEKKKYISIIIISLIVALMSGGKSNIVTMLFPIVLQCANVIQMRKIGYIGACGVLSIFVIGMAQMNMSFGESITYNAYRATSLATMGSVGVWDHFKDSCPTAYNSIILGFGENILSNVTGIPRNSPEFLKYSLQRYITYLYYPNSQGALDGTVNLTITCFGETIYWCGRKYYYILSAVFSMIIYKILILMFKTRRTSRIKSNAMYTIFFGSVVIPWMNSTQGSFLSYFFGFTTLIYLFMTYILICYILKTSRKI